MTPTSLPGPLIPTTWTREAASDLKISRNREAENPTQLMLLEQQAAVVACDDTARRVSVSASSCHHADSCVAAEIRTLQASFPPGSPAAAAHAALLPRRHTPAAPPPDAHADASTAALCAALTAASANISTLASEWVLQLSIPELVAADTRGASHQPPPSLHPRGWVSAVAAPFRAPAPPSAPRPASQAQCPK